MKTFRSTSLFCLIFLMAAAGLRPAAAQTRGAVTGRVLDADEGLPLPGATVAVEGTAWGTATDLSGRFTLHAVPEGTQRLSVSYLGYRSQTVEVAVAAGAVATVEATLESDLLELDGVTVEAIRQGQARALNQQKTALNIKNVVAADLMGRFPDPNAAEALQRVPGLSVQRDHGEGRYVLIRGMDARLTNVMINGEAIPSPEGQIRSVALDVIPADQLASIEVNKALTPDLDADGIGGSVNLITKTPRVDCTTLKASLATGYNSLVGNDNFQGAFTYGSRTGKDGRLGFVFSGSYYRTDRGTDNNEMTWGAEDFDDAEHTVLEDFQLRDYVITRERLGLSGAVDYALGENSVFYARGIFNRFGDQEYRRRLRVRFDKGDYESPTQVTDARLEREIKDRYEVQDVYSLQLGAEHTLARQIALSYSLSASHAHEREPDRRDMTFRQKKVDLSYDVSDPAFPAYSIDNGKDPYDPAAYAFDDLVIENNMTTDQNLTARLDVSVPYHLGANTGTIKLGGKYRAKRKDQQNDVRILDGFEGDLMMDQVVGTFEDDDFMEGRYQIGQSPGPDQVEAFYDEHAGLFELNENDSREDTDPANYEATEHIAAGYAQAALTAGRVQALFGVRYEHTDLDYTGNEVVFDDEGDYESTQPVGGANTYGHFFPMLHLRYSLTERTNLRFAATRSLSRPHYYDLVPYRFVKREKEELERGNPLLQPTTASNLDVLAEHYVASLGIVSAGAFYNRLNDYVYESISEIDGGVYDQYEAVQPVNGEQATLWGFEVNWQQQLTFLPGFLDGLGIYANYTYTTSKANVENRDESIPLPGQATHTGNIAVSYEKHGFSGRVSLNLHGKYIDLVGEEAIDDVYYDRHVQVDASASQRILPNLRVFVEVINLTNTPLRYYQGTSSRPIVQEYYSWWSHVGLKFDF